MILKFYFMPKKTVIAALVLAIIFQMFFSFASPAYEQGNSCQHSVDYFLNTNADRMKNVFSVNKSELSLTALFFQYFPNYRVICDSMSFIYHAKTGFPYGFEERNIYIDHPLYEFFSFIILKPISWFHPISYPIIFAVFIFINFLMMLTTVFLFYNLIARIISSRVAVWSAFLLIFSPFTHTLISQPTTSAIMEIFVVVGCLWLLYDYSQKPGRRKLFGYSLLFGVLLLGKQIVALSLFALFLSWYFGRKKEGAIFFGLHLAPTILWYLFVKFILNLPYLAVNVSGGQGSWFLRADAWEFFKMSHIAITSIPNFFVMLVYGFILLPVLLAFFGLYKMELKHKYLLFFSFLASFQVLFMVMNYYRPSLSFLMFPVIYPAAICGLISLSEYLKKYGDVAVRIFFYAVIIFIIIISNLNVYNFGIWDVKGM